MDFLRATRTLKLGKAKKGLVLFICLGLASPGLFPATSGMAQIAPGQVVSLKEVPVPVPMAAVIEGPIPGPGTDLDFQPLTTDIVKDQAALVRLGKALFWDMQVGSDGIVACATCHFSAGADRRSRNQVSPGLKDVNFHGRIGGDNSFGNSTVPFTANDPNTPNPPGPSEPPPAALNVPGIPRFRPNYQLRAADFPLNDWFNTTLLTPRGPGVTLLEEMANVSRDTNDVVSSQGVRHQQFVGVTAGSAVDRGTDLPDIFNTLTPGRLRVANKTRRVEPRNAPTVINAVFHYDNFWDGRASYVFNGVNPFGFRDRTSTLKKNINGTMTDVFIRVINSSLASQAVGPPGSDFEMSWKGRTFPDIGRKMVSLRPLAKQLVHPSDSVLGPLSRATLTLAGTPTGLRGLGVPTYATMIRAAFKDHWWNSTGTIAVESSTMVVKSASVADPRTMVLNPGRTSVSAAPVTAANQYTQMEFNFSLFFGLAVQAYEATLVSDDTPYDRFVGAPSLGIPPNPAAMTAQQIAGLALFQDTEQTGSKCAACHRLPITTTHTVMDYQPNAQGVPSANGEAIEFMLMGDNGEIANYDQGMYNIGVRRTTEDIGRGDNSPFPNPLTGANFPISLVELAALRSTSVNPGGILLPGDVARFIPDVPIVPRRVTKGAFKTPNLRNIRFSGPYFRNGDSSTLRQAVEFYVRGGNFPNTNLSELAPDIEGIPPLMFPESDPAARANIEALVAFMAGGLTDQRVAFERAPFDHPQLFVPNGAPINAPATDLLMEIPAVGRNGLANPLPLFLNLNPQTP